MPASKGRGRGSKRGLMSVLWIGILWFLLIGSCVGFLSGLLGIGGGIVIVPALAWIFEYYTPLAIPADKVMHISAGTSLATMVVTALAAIFAHHKQANIDWKVCFKLLPATIVGVILGSWIASLLRSHTLAIVFAVLLLLIAIYIFFSAKKEKNDCQITHINLVIYSLSGFIIGVCSGMLGVGGGSLVIPFLLLLHFPINRVSGTSVTLVLPLAIVGTIAFILMGNLGREGIPYSSGFIYWPAFLGISIGSIFVIQVGTKVGKRANKVLLKRIFSILLVIIALQMLLT